MLVVASARLLPMRFGGTGAIAVNLFAIALLAVFVGLNAYPSSETVRLRNALLVEVGQSSDFDWVPPDFPAGFARDSGAAVFSEQVAAILTTTEGDDWSKARALASHLLEKAQDKDRISSSDLVDTYRKIREGYGYCGDFVDVFLAMARAAGLSARAWAFSFDGFGGHGHVFVEVYDRQRAKWVFMDVYNNMLAVDASTREQLSALELRDVLLGKRGPGRFERIGAGRFPYKHEDKAWDYYGRGAHQWYMWWGNAVENRHRHFLVSRLDAIAHPLGEMAAITVGVFPSIRVLPTPENEALLASMFSLRRTLLLALLLGSVLVLLLLVQVGFAVRRGLGARQVLVPSARA